MQHGHGISLAVRTQLPCDPQVLHVETEMSKILTRVLDPATSDELKTLAEAQVRSFTVALQFSSSTRQLGRHHHCATAMTSNFASVHQWKPLDGVCCMYSNWSSVPAEKLCVWCHNA